MHFTNLPQFFLDTFSIVNLKNLKVAKIDLDFMKQKENWNSKPLIQNRICGMESVVLTTVTNSQTKYSNETLT